MQEMMENLVEYGYILLFLYSFGGGMIGILAAAALSSSAKFDLHLCIALAFLGNALGSTLFFIMGKYCKKDLMPYLRKHRRKLALAMIKIKRQGVGLFVVQKFVYGLRTLIPMAAAFARYNFLKFFIINTIASLVWAVSLGYLGFTFGYFFEMFFNKLGEHPYMAPLFLISLAIGIWFYLSLFSKK